MERPPASSPVRGHRLHGADQARFLYSVLSAKLDEDAVAGSMGVAPGRPLRIEAGRTEHTARRRSVTRSSEATRVNSGHSVRCADHGHTAPCHPAIRTRSGHHPFHITPVAGVAALVWSKNVGLKNSDVESILKNSAANLGPIGFDSTYGYGLVNAEAALAATP